MVTHLSHAMPRDDRVAPPNTSLAPPVAPPLSRFPISVDVVVASSSIAGEGEEAHRPSASHLGALLAHWFDRALSPTAAQVSALVSETFIISYYFPTPILILSILGIMRTSGSGTYICLCARCFKHIGDFVA